MRSRNPEGASEVTGTATQLFLRQGWLTRPAAACLPVSTHQIDPFDRLGGAKQDGCRDPFWFGHRVDQVVDAVVQIDIRPTRSSIQRRVSSGQSGGGVTGRIALTDVGLDLDDQAGCSTARADVNQRLPDQVPSDL